MLLNKFLFLIIQLTHILTCFIELISLTVTVPSEMVFSSIVQANGIPTSSVLAYLLPIASAISSILYEIPLATKLDPKINLKIITK